MRPSDPLLTGADQSDSLFTIEASVALLNFKAEPGDGGTLVSWSTNPTVGPEGLAGYRLYRVPPGSGEGPGVTIGPPLIRESSYRDAGAPAGAGYRLCAVNGLQQELDKLGFETVGYGCTTCIGNSGPLHPAVEDAIKAGDLVCASVLSGNRNF